MKSKHVDTYKMQAGGVRGCVGGGQLPSPMSDASSLVNCSLFYQLQTMFDLNGHKSFQFFPPEPPFHPPDRVARKKKMGMVLANKHSTIILILYFNIYNFFFTYFLFDRYRFQPIGLMFCMCALLTGLLMLGC